MAKKILAENLKQQAHKLAAQKAAAEEKGNALNGVALTIAAKVSATGQLYGSVNTATVAEELKKLGHEVDRKIITMRDIKKVGEYVALVHFHKEVTVEIPVTVVAENAPVEEVKAEVAAPAVEEAPVVEAPAQEEEAPAAE
jgi:large subunit ribosomal protein L9